MDQAYLEALVSKTQEAARFLYLQYNSQVDMMYVDAAVKIPGAYHIREFTFRHLTLQALVRLCPEPGVLITVENEEGCDDTHEVRATFQFLGLPSHLKQLCEAQGKGEEQHLQEEAEDMSDEAWSEPGDEDESIESSEEDVEAEESESDED